MACIDSDKFSANDLTLFIESMEQISRMESLKWQRQQISRAGYSADTLRYFDQQYTGASSSTLTSTEQPEEECIMESFEENHIGCNSTCLVQNQYYEENQNDGHYNKQDDSISCHSIIYSIPFDCVTSTDLDDSDYDSLDLSHIEDVNDHYEEISQVVKKTKPKKKFSLFGLVRKKYKKCFSKKTTESWPKSDSWTKLWFYK